MTTTKTIISKYVTVKDDAYPVMDSSTPFFSANFHVEDNDVYYGDGATMTATAVADSTISLEKGDLHDIFFKNKIALNVAHISVVATIEKPKE